jgi:hypothetical protein
MRSIEQLLSQERGKRLCNGDQDNYTIEEGGEARTWGLELDALKDAIKRKVRVSLDFWLWVMTPGDDHLFQPQVVDVVKETLDEAIKELIDLPDVITGQDLTYVWFNSPRGG